MTTNFIGLAAFGWSNHFQSQLTADDSDGGAPARVLAVHRNGLDVGNPHLAARISPLASDEDEGRATVGDWVIVDVVGGTPRRLLERKSLFKRRAAGTGRQVQLIAANVDTLLIVTSCNQDFNIARLERYLALAREAEVTPVIVLTKADLVDDVTSYQSEALKVMAGVLVECLDARDPDAVEALRPWCAVGQTVAFVGSSGVGKSTLVNTLTGDALLATAAIREDDGRGRHTTTGRSMHRLAAGGWLLDTPGMRELRIADAAEGVADVFADIGALAATCRFTDCRHETEPGCAVRAAIESKELDPARLVRFRKLAREEARNTERPYERRARARSFGKMVKSIMKEKRGE